MAQPGAFKSPNDEAWIGRKFTDIERSIRELAAANPFAPMGILPRKGGIDVRGFVNSLRADGTVGVSMDDDGIFIVYGPDGTTPVARFGPLESAPGEYGVEVLVGTTWVQLGNQSAVWEGIAGRPGTTGGATIPGNFITGTVPAATEAAHAAQADGSQYGWTNNVAGTTFYQVWVGNDGGFHFGRNTSSIAYKENVRAHSLDPAKVLELVPVIYDRKEGGTDEYGLIAEQVAEHVPELLVWFDGKIDGLRYDLLPVALLDVVRDQENRIRALEGRAPLPARTPTANTPAPGAPTPTPEPLPYTIHDAA